LANHSSVASGVSLSIHSGLGLRGITVPFSLIGAAQAFGGIVGQLHMLAPLFFYLLYPQK
jgi:hypothetical protein